MQLRNKIKEEDFQNTSATVDVTSMIKISFGFLEKRAGFEWVNIIISLLPLVRTLLYHNDNSMERYYSNDNDCDNTILIIYLLILFIYFFR